MAGLPAGLANALQDRYRLDRELGQGGMATVYLAHDLRHNRPVALKVLRPRLAALLGADRFLKEIETTANLQHPHILPLFDSGQAGAAPDGVYLYYVMPLVEGESLRDRLQREKQLPIPDALRIAIEVTSALDYAHRHGVVHRDIKPENILLHEGQALVADFGIARAARGPEAARLTETGVTVGTPAYMSPEQAAGDRELDGRTDIYSLGCVLYEMLAGEPPYAGPTPGAVLARRFRGPVSSLRTLRQTVPPWLEQAVDTALATVPGDRFGSAADFGRALASPESPSGSAPPRPGVGKIGGGRLWRRLLGATGAAAVVAGVFAGGVLLTHRGSGATGIGTPAAGARRSLAVLPFTSPDRDSANLYFGVGMAEELTTAFAGVQGLRVASRGSASRFQDAGTSEAEIARQLGVETILEGSVRRSGSRLRVTARLVDPKGTVLWADRYDRGLAEVFEVQDDITRAILTALRPTFGDTTRLAVAHPAPRTGDLDAYDRYLKGRYYWSRRGEGGLRTAIQYFEQAIARDSSFGAAWAGLSMAQVVLPLFVNLPADTLLAAASRNAQRALRLDPTLADAHLAWAYALKDQWRWDASEQQFQQALALAPDDATIHHWYGVLLHVTGRVPEAVEQLRLARQLDPLAVQIRTDGYYVLYLARRFDEALTESRRVWAMDTTKADGSLQIGMIQLARGRPDSALVAFEGAGRLGIGFDMRAFRAVALHQLHRTRQADSLYAAVLEQYRTDPSLAYAVAVAAAGTGHLEQAISAVAAAVDRRSLFVTELSLPCDPLFDQIRKDPRFTTLLRRAGMRVCRPE